MRDIDKAVAAAADALRESGRWNNAVNCQAEARKAIEAALPYLLPPKRHRDPRGGRAPENEARAAEIWDRRENGASFRGLGRAYGLSAEWIRQIYYGEKRKREARARKNDPEAHS